MEARKLLYTVDEFERLADAPENRDRLLELIDGEIVEKAPTQDTAWLPEISTDIYGMISGRDAQGVRLWKYVIAPRKIAGIPAYRMFRTPGVMPRLSNEAAFTFLFGAFQISRLKRMIAPSTCKTIP
jgi:hypothetical protein